MAIFDPNPSRPRKNASNPYLTRPLSARIPIFDPNPYLTRKNVSNPYLTRPLSASVAQIPTLYRMLQTSSSTCAPYACTGAQDVSLVRHMKTRVRVISTIVPARNNS